jgi:dienelactone hydrolase
MDLLQKHFTLSKIPIERVEIPFDGVSLPGYFYRAESLDGKPTPVMIHWNGLDSTKEMMYYTSFCKMMAERGISTLMVDTPGSGEALRLRGMTARHATDAWAAPIVDFAENIDGTDPNAIGIIGWSLGGYYAPRAAAFEKRLKLAVAWGANHNWAAVQEARRNREGSNPVPHYWDHVFWVWGVNNMADFIQVTQGMHLNGVAEKITVPLLVMHGANDRQIPVKYAHETFDQAVNSPKRELRIYDEPEGGTEHMGIDHMPYVASYLADWIYETFEELKHS